MDNHNSINVQYSTFFGPVALQPCPPRKCPYKILPNSVGADRHGLTISQRP